MVIRQLEEPGFREVKEFVACHLANNRQGLKTDLSILSLASLSGVPFSNTSK